MTKYPSRYPSLDVWRGVACLLVIIFHAGLYGITDAFLAYAQGPSPSFSVAQWLLVLSSRGWIGVPLFFVISGYCIAATADSTRARGLATQKYFQRRLRRIVPPYWIALVGTSLVLAAAAVVGVLEVFTHPLRGLEYLNAPWSLGPLQWLGNLTLTEGWRGHVGLGPDKRWLMETAWTLGYEEQFYAVMGGILFVSRRRLFPLTLAVTVGVLLICLVSTPPAGLFFDGYWLLFASGIWVYYDLVHATRPAQWIGRLSLGFGTAWAMLRPDELRALGLHFTQDLAVATSFALLLLALRASDRALMADRLLAPVRWCGERCYSLYLVHYPVTKGISRGLVVLGLDEAWHAAGIAIPLSIAVSVGVAAPFHRYVERRFLNSAPTTSDQGQSKIIAA